MRDRGEGVIITHCMQNNTPGLLDGGIVRICQRCRLFVNADLSIERGRYDGQFLAKYEAAPEEMKCNHKLLQKGVVVTLAF